MSIKPCKECGTPISDKAKVCIKCGATVPKKTSVTTWVVTIFFMLMVIGMLDIDKTPTSSGVESAKEQINTWEYDSSKDDMRNIAVKYAFLKSKNKTFFDFPHEGGSDLRLMLRKKEKEKTEVAFTISKGHIICSSIDGCSVAVKFDDGSVENYTMVGSDSGSSETIFVAVDEERFIKKIKSSKALVIEIPFYRTSKRQFQFDLSGLSWD